MKRKFDIKKNCSTYWKNEADNSHTAALALDETIKKNDSFRVKRSLENLFDYSAATSIELNLKACIIEQRFKDTLRRLLDENESKIIHEDDINFELGDDFYSHNLSKLSEKARLIVHNEKEKNILKILTHVIYWTSRYPIPKKEDTYTDYNYFLQEALFLPKPIGQKLRGRAIDPEMILDLENYLMLWNKTEEHYKKIKGK